MKHHHEIKKSILVATESPELKEEIKNQLESAKASNSPKPSIEKLLSTKSNNEKPKNED